MEFKGGQQDDAQNFYHFTADSFNMYLRGRKGMNVKLRSQIETSEYWLGTL